MIKTKRKKRFQNIPLILLSLFVFIVPIKAKEEIIGYTLDLQENHVLSKYISSLVLFEDNDNWVLSINNKEVGRNNIPSFVYKPNTNVEIDFDFNIGNNVNIKYRINQTEVFTSEFVLSVVDGIQSVDFYPDINSNYHITKEAKLNNGFYDLGEFSCKLNGKDVVFNLLIDTKADVAYITKGQTVQKYILSQDTIIQRIFLETHVDKHPLDSSYLMKLTPKSLYSAKNINYSTTEVDRAINSEILTLIHKRSGLTYNTPLERIISIWTRLGEESYDITKVRESQVVCQYNEDACSIIRNKDAQRFLVLANSYEYDAIEKDYRDVSTTSSTKLYQNVYWYPSQDKTSTSFPSVSNYGVVYYKSRSGSWSAYSNYIYTSSAKCDKDDYCESKSTTKYSKATRSFEGYKQQQKSVGTIDSWSSFIGGSKPNNTNTYRYRDYYKYTCKKGTNTETKYSTISYSLNQQGLCSSGYKITGKTQGYQRAKINWSSYSDVDSCVASTGYTKCQSVTKFRYTDWSIFSGYIYDSCENSEYVKCKSETKYAYRYINWDNWTSYKKTNNRIINSKLYEVEYKYNNGSIKWEDFKGTSTTLGTNVYYTGQSIVENITSTNKIETIKVVKKNVGNLEYQTEQDILKIADNIAKEVQLVAMANKLGSNVSYSELNDYYQKHQSEYLNVYQSAYNKFINSNIFIPYIYVLDHYRAIYRDLSIDGYQTSLSNINTVTNNSVNTYTFELIPYKKEINRETKVIYFDPKNPFYNYEELPENWKEYSYLVNKIKNLDFNSSDITIKLTKDDLKNMKEYIDAGGSIDDYDFILRFKYIFEGNINIEDLMKDTEED